MIIDAIINGRNYDIEGITDRGLTKGTMILGFPVIGSDKILPEIFNKGVKNAFISVGSIGDCTVRRKLFSMAKDIGFSFPAIIHPKAVVAVDVKIGAGTFVAASATINPGTMIGRHAIINTSASIDHDCEIGDFVHIAPGTTLSGSVKIGEETHVGTGSSVIQRLRIGKKCMIAAGVTVRHDMLDETKTIVDMLHIGKNETSITGKIKS